MPFLSEIVWKSFFSVDYLSSGLHIFWVFVWLCLLYVYSLQIDPSGSMLMVKASDGQSVQVKLQEPLQVR